MSVSKGFKENNFFKNTIIVIFFTLLTKFSGLLREVVLANYYGSSITTDAYIISNSAYSLIFSSLSAAITISYIQHCSNKKDKIDEITTKLLFIVSLLVFAVSFILILFPNIFISLFALGMDIETQKLTTEFLRIILPFVFLISITYILQAFLQVKNKFGVSKITNFITNMIAIIAIILSLNNKYILVYGNNIAVLFCFIFICFYIKKEGFKFNFNDFFDLASIKPILVMMLPLLLGEVSHQISLIIDKNFSSYLGEGFITNFNYANKVNILFTSIIVMSITTVIFPTLSKLASKSRVEFNSFVTRIISIIILVALPISLLLFVTSQEIITILFYRGEFSVLDLERTSSILSIYGICLVFLSLIDIFNKIFYANGDTKTPVILSFISTLLNIMLNFILVDKIGYVGLALSTTICFITLCLLLYIKTEKMYKIGIFKNIKSTFMSYFVSNTFFLLIICFVKFKVNIDLTNILYYVLTVVIASTFYLLILYFFNNKDVDFLIKKILKGR